MLIGKTIASPLEDSQSTFSIGGLIDGDIVLIYSRPQSILGRVFRSINTMGQRLLAAIRRVERVSIFARIPSFSHAMIGIGGGLVIHADGKRVSIEVISDVIRSEMKDAARFAVYRHKSLSPQAAAAIVKTAYSYYNQSYGFLPYFGSLKRKLRRKEDTTQFCSRLVAHAYGAAGCQLTTLADARVLPIDLYRICQSNDWQEVTAEFIEKTFSEEIDCTLADTGIADIDGRTFQEFLKRSEMSLRKGAGLQRDFLDMRYKSMKDQLQAQALIAQSASLQLDLVRITRVAPDLMDERVAGWVKSTLEQLPIVLFLSELSDVRLFAACSPLSELMVAEGGDDRATFVGFPTPSVLQEIMMYSEVLRAHASLLAAELGMLVIASQLVEDPRFEPFKAIGTKYAEDFLAVVPTIDGLQERLNSVRDSFLWVESDSDREMCRNQYDTIIKLLQMVSVLREVGTVQ